MDKIWYVTTRGYMGTNTKNQGFYNSEEKAFKRRDELSKDYDYTYIKEVHGPFHVE